MDHAVVEGDFNRRLRRCHMLNRALVCIRRTTRRRTNGSKEMEAKIREKEVGFLFFFLFFLFAFVFVKGVTRLDFYQRWARFAVVLFLSDYATFDTCSNYRMKDESLIALAFVVSIRGKGGGCVCMCGVWGGVCMCECVSRCLESKRQGGVFALWRWRLKVT